MPTKLYLQKALENIKPYLPPWMWRSVHAQARGYAGGKSYPKKDDHVAALLEVAKVNPVGLKTRSDDEVKNIHERLHNLYRNAMAERLAIEPYVNAHAFVADELVHRGLAHELRDGLDRASLHWQSSHDKSLTQPEAPNEGSTIGDYLRAKGLELSRRERLQLLGTLASKTNLEDTILLQGAVLGAFKDWLAKYRPKISLVELEEVTPPEGGYGARWASLMGSLRPFQDRIKKIIEDIPHKRCVELFGGMGELMWITDEPIIFNDKDPRIVELHKIVAGLSDSDIEKLGEYNWVGSKTRFDTVREMKPRSKLDRLYQFTYLARFGRNGRTPWKDTFEPPAKGQNHWPNIGNRLRLARERFKNVKWECSDWSECLRKYDSPDTLIFCDPPYPGREEYYNVADIDWNQLCDELSKAKSSVVLVTMNDDNDTLKPFRESKVFERMVWHWRMSMRNVHKPEVQVKFPKWRELNVFIKRAK